MPGADLLSLIISYNITRFVYTHTDDRGWPTYQYLNSQHQVMYLHFYDEGLFYDGFYVINDLEVRGQLLISMIAGKDTFI